MGGSQYPLYLIACRPRLTVCNLLIAFIVATGGCSQPPPRIEAPPATVYPIEPGTLRAIDERILDASVYAKHESEACARVAMDEWRSRVREYTEDVFIPWYTSYWTQQWIATRVAWYRLQYVEGEATPEDRLVSYLQEQFYIQVLEPVSSFVDPHTVMGYTTDSYVRELKDRLDPLPFEYRIPVDAFNRHLDTIPAIVVLAETLQEASLRQVLQTVDLSDLPAYVILLGNIAAVNDTPGPTPSPDRLHAVARRAVTRLVGSLALSGGAAAASTVVGGFWGILISMGSAAWSMKEHEQDKPEMEAQLQGNLDAALGSMWQDLVEDKYGGVTAVVHHMSEHIESAVTYPRQIPQAPAILEPAGLF